MINLQLSKRLITASQIIPELSSEFDVSSKDHADRIYGDLITKTPPSSLQMGPELPSTTGRNHIFNCASTSFLSCPSFSNTVLKKLLNATNTNPFQGQIIIDLGAGRTAGGYELATKLGAQAYIAVEYCFAPWLINAIEESRPETPIPYAVIYSEIAKVLEQLPAGRCSFFISAIDDSLFYDENKTKNAIESYVDKALHKDGYCLIYSNNWHKTYEIPLLYQYVDHGVYLAQPLTSDTKVFEDQPRYTFAEVSESHLRKKLQDDEVTRYLDWVLKYGPGGGEFGQSIRQRNLDNPSFISSADRLDRHYEKMKKLLK